MYVCLIKMIYKLFIIGFLFHIFLAEKGTTLWNFIREGFLFFPFLSLWLMRQVLLICNLTK